MARPPTTEPHVERPGPAEFRDPLVRRELQKAAAHVEKSQADVVTARRALKGVELVEERLKTEERKAEERADQKLSDAFAQNIARGKGKP